MFWWKAKIDSSKSSASRTLTEIVLKKIGKNFCVRMNFADGRSIDTDYWRVPRFDLGEVLTVTPAEEFEVQAAPETSKTFWVCGKTRGSDTQGNPSWDLQGVFDSESAASAACQEQRDFIGPVPLNQMLPQSPTDWPGCRYPFEELMRP